MICVFIMFGIVSVANDVRALDKDRFKVLKDNNDFYSEEIRENIRLESTRYQCWKSTRCTHDKVPVCCLEASFEKELKPRTPQNKLFRMFPDECTMYAHNCENGTLYEVSVSKALCRRDEEATEDPSGRRRSSFLPAPRVQLVQGIPNKYYI